ncbi:hypothetical protein S101468_02202 [Acetobacter pasteurianus subsp. pasteurianus]|uniref:Uncharacterized protein n=2 Tax=Acetobacter pasteurianus TaxID=438 RepID=A0A401WUX9_ACEPA|nr:hypothetical protein S101468_02202 [Acetobacter pasteurianus subsp. pasteurianus]GCD53143.1 hypothetical protein NBRC3188_1840 [Acetobacter pasteurianus NBRC 3188]
MVSLVLIRLAMNLSGQQARGILECLLLGAFYIHIENIKYIMNFNHD